MGVINLGLLVDKIKRKLEGSGFIKNTDYASASKAGVVKIGAGIDVSENGTISANIPTSSGITCDELFTGTITKGTAFTILHPYTDYVFLQIHIVSGSEGSYDSIVSVPGLATGSNNVNSIVIANTQNALRVDPENPTSLLLTGSGSITNAKVYGYK